MTRGRVTTRGLILLAESDEGMRAAITNLLEASGFPTVAYSTGTALLDGGRAREAHCVIGDIHLSDTSGFDLLARLRERDVAAPVILISAHNTVAIRKRAAKCGAAAYLAKPFAGNALIGEIERITEAARLKRSGHEA